MENDEQARIARARRLREQIAQVVGGQRTDQPTTPAGASPDGASPAAGVTGADGGATPVAEPAAASNADAPKSRPTKESPRDFIHRRMRELDEGKGK